MANNATRIEEIRTILRTGIKSQTTDGVSVSYDLDSLRRELAQLEDDDFEAQTRRPRVSSVELGNLF